MLTLRQIKPSDAGVYILAQLAGGVAGAGLTKLILVDEGASESYGAPAISLARDGEVVAAMAVEALGTFFLVWAIIGVAVNPPGRQGLGGVRHRWRARRGGDGLRA